jgi:hypothetical protein
MSEQERANFLKAAGRRLHVWGDKGEIGRHLSSSIRKVFLNVWVLRKGVDKDQQAKFLENPVCIVALLPQN